MKDLGHEVPLLLNAQQPIPYLRRFQLGTTLLSGRDGNPENPVGYANGNRVVLPDAVGGGQACTSRIPREAIASAGNRGQPQSSTKRPYL